MAATQFEAVEARRCFPCWDEPALKVLSYNRDSLSLCSYVVALLVTKSVERLFGVILSLCLGQASFRISLDVPCELTALSNMPVLEEKVKGTRKTVHFEESPLMSTYLVAIVVGLFDVITDTTADGM